MHRSHVHQSHEILSLSDLLECFERHTRDIGNSQRGITKEKILKINSSHIQTWATAET